MRGRKLWSVVAPLLLLSLAALPAAGRFAQPPEAPVERLVANVSAYVKAHPDDANGYYTLGRIHALALALKQTTLRAFNPQEEGGLPRFGPAMFNRPADKPEVDAKALREHLIAAVENYNQALARDDKNGLYHLGLASVLEAAVESKIELPALPGYKKGGAVADWAGVYVSEAVDHYAAAFKLAVDKDSAMKSRPIAGLNSLVSYEAGKRYLELIGRPGVAEGQKADAEVVRKGLATLDAKPRGPVTPIVFSLQGATRLDELLGPAGRTVRFDLNGTGRGQAWPWVKGDTGILVWDPRHTGRVESGKQLFGSVTWWVFWADGYSALSALDDDRDGKLSGDELRGLAVWFDRDGNGVSDPGEVVPVESVGLEWIDVRATGREGRSPSNAAGMRLKDGRTVGTWDWVTEAVK